MKSFTRNHPNPQILRADKRFDVLVKKQEAEHQHALSGHNKDMQGLRDKLSLSMEKAESVSQKTALDLADFKTQATYAINVLKERTQAQECVIAEQKKSIESFQDQLINFQALYCSRRDVENIKKEMEARVREATNSHLCSLQELQRRFKLDLSILKDDLDKFKEDADRRLSEQSNRIEMRFKENKLDREGVLREIRIREKELFIIEKKIENIYTLIERINKRGESCRKPE